MNLKEIFDRQAELDAHIESNLPEPHSKLELWLKRTLAFKTELGELLNERPDVFKFWKKSYTVDDNKALVEYVDGLHFAISIGIMNGADANRDYLPIYHDDLQEQFYQLFNVEPVWEVFIRKYIGLGEMLGFSEEQIMQAYREKNAVNHERQNTGY